MIDYHKMSFSVPGMIVYDPVRGYDKNGKPIVNKGRCTIRLAKANDLCRYYAYQFRKKFGIDLLPPDWDPHVTIIAKNQFNKKKAPWGFKNGEIVHVQYSHQMFWNNEHVWVAAECAELMELREHYGNLSYDRGHMTIGRFRVEDVDRLPHFKKPADITLWKKYHWNNPL